MKLFTLALLLANTSAKALTAPAFCATAADYKLYSVYKIAAHLLARNAIKCTKNEADAVPTDKQLAYSQKIELGMAENLVTTVSDNRPDTKTFYDNLTLIGAAAGIGNMSCPLVKELTGAALTACTGAARKPLKGSLEYQKYVYGEVNAYLMAFLEACDKVKDATAKTKCFTDGYADLLVLAKSSEVADLNAKTTDERATWMKAEDKKRLLAAAPVIAAGKVGFPCKAAAAVSPATVGVRPACDAANCCMGHKKAATDTTNTGGEFCQLKTATKGNVVNTAATATIDSGYITKKAAVTASYDGACIEGAIRATSAALSVLATAYMMS